MAPTPTFSKEVSNLLHAAHGNPINTCIQCGTCSATCPVVEFMDQTPPRLIGMIGANLKDEVLTSNTFWYCASCYHCTVRCPSEIDIAELMYALKRYSMWKNQYQEGLIGPVFSETFVKTIVKSGRSYEPVLAPPTSSATAFESLCRKPRPPQPDAEGEVARPSAKDQKARELQTDGE